MLFEHVEGTVAEQAGAASTVALAETTADIQSAASGRDLAGLPSLLPHLLGDLDDQPPALVDELEKNRPRLIEWASELDHLVPHSIDLVDLHLSNAMCASDGRLVILDWEEAVISCPVFSLERLLVDAAEAGVEDDVSRTYIERLLPDLATTGARGRCAWRSRSRHSRSPTRHGSSHGYTDGTTATPS